MRYVFLLAFFLMAMSEAQIVVSSTDETDILAKQVSWISSRMMQAEDYLCLKDGMENQVDVLGAEPDLVCEIAVKDPGLYIMQVVAGVDEATAAHLQTAKTKFDSLFMRLQFDDDVTTRRVVFAPWFNPAGQWNRLGIFPLDGNTQRVRMWLPPGVRLKRIQFAKYSAPAVPEAAKSYGMPIRPPQCHPRLWLTAERIPEIRDRLTKGENAFHWERCRKEALREFVFNPPAGQEISYDSKLEVNARCKAFYYLMTGDREVGRKAVDMMDKYISQVSFGNLLDITREMGRAIYTCSHIYDWCHDLMTDEQRARFREKMLDIAREMECGWPPFRQSIIHGHGNEAQVLRDLLAMSIAVFDEDPEPYRYCAFQILEQLVPMRAFEYDSPRHNQGTNYGTARFLWELQAALMFRGMLGRDVFQDNMKNLYLYWFYSRRPDETLFTCGDNYYVYTRPWKYDYAFTLLNVAYARNPYYRADLLHYDLTKYSDAVDFLLWNDPEQEARPLSELPLTLDYGPVYGGMATRTGWDFSEDSGDVVAQIVGGGFNVGGHQQADAGSFQVFCHGELVSDLAQYRFYGVPYDWNYAKRSISKSMLLVEKPGEKFGLATVNDGGTRFLRGEYGPLPENLKAQKECRYGTVLYSVFGPSQSEPDFSCFAADLAEAYGEKVQSYVRRFHFLDLKDGVHPAMVVVLDDLETSQPEYKRHWQLNTRAVPTVTEKGVHLEMANGKSSLQMEMLTPSDCEVTVLSGQDTLTVDGQQFLAPYDTPDDLGHRIQFTPKSESRHTVFLAVMQVGEGVPEPLPYVCREMPEGYALFVKDRLLVMPKGNGFFQKDFTLEIPEGTEKCNACLSGLAAGKWEVVSPDGTASVLTVSVGKNAAFLSMAPGTWKVRKK